MLRDLWMRLVLGLARRQNRPADLNSLYVVENPWKMDSEREVFRFEQTNKFILDEIGEVGTLLEIGCGEGHQSEYLRRISHQLVGIDVSERAVARARRRCPDCTFLVGGISSAARLAQGSHDLIVAFEVLYYLDDVAVALDEIRGLGSHLVASCYHDQYQKVAPAIVAAFPQTRQSKIAFGETIWHFFVARLTDQRDAR
jgi:SAM-dependent methyltransferase